MGGEFACQQAGVRAGDDHVFSSSQKSVDEQMPALDILNLVKEEMIDLTIHRIDGLQDIVQIASIQFRQCLVIEIHIAELDARGLHGLSANNRLARTTYAENGLSQWTFHIHFLHRQPIQNGRLHHAFKFKLLLKYDFLQVSSHYTVSLAYSKQPSL